MSTIKQKDIELWQEWKKTGSQEALQKLMKQMEPVIYKEVQKWSGNIPMNLLEHEAKLLAMKAFKTYDPSKGTALSTHVVNQLKPLSRFVYTHQNVARIPSEVRIGKISNLKNIISEFNARYGRDPNIDELSDLLGISRKELKKFLRELHPDFLESLMLAPSQPMYDPETDRLIYDFYNSLSPIEKLVFEHSVGYHKKRLTIEEIAKKTGLSVYEIRRMREDIGKRLKEYLSKVAPAYAFEMEGISFPDTEAISAVIRDLSVDPFEEPSPWPAITP